LSSLNDYPVDATKVGGEGGGGITGVTVFDVQVTVHRDKFLQ